MNRISTAEPYGVYVHIPFCAKKCDYCAFATWTDRSHLVDDYVDACRKEIVAARSPIATSVFFGGGTPSLIPGRQLVAVLDEIERVPGAEVTVECNPDTVTHQLLETYVAGGVNRISLGVQSMVPHVLASLGRTHDVDNVRRSIDIAASVGIERVNIDLIYGAAGESLLDWRRSVQQCLESDVGHVSAYGLTVEAGTPLATDTTRHPDEDDQAGKYEMVDDLAEAAGLSNYEISNWARPGEECRHNLLYWSQGNYRGIGCAAHSHQDGHRWWNLRTPERYIDAVDKGLATRAAGEELDRDTQAFERLELALRMREGVPVDALPVTELADFVTVRDGRAILNRRGRLMASEIATRLRT